MTESMHIPDEVDARVDSAGRIVIPAPVRRLLDMTPGSRVRLRVAGDELHLRSASAELRLAQQRFAELYSGAGSAVDDFIAFKRAEAAREQPRV